MADIGYIALVLGFVVSIYTAAASFMGQRGGNPKLVASARNGVFTTLVLVTLSAAMLLYALIAHDFQIDYVASYTSRDMSLPYLISALWAGNAGSLLLWAWLLSIFSMAVLLWKTAASKNLLPYVISVMMGVVAFFLLLLVFVVSPFDKLPFTPPDGTGLNPLLQNAGMVFHPPTLLAGFAGLSVPFAFAVAALITNGKAKDWLVDLRRWVLIAWLFLTIGNVLGAWWAYVELGWGGYWAWDPVENSSLIPWLVATALLHSIIMQRTKGRYKVWSIVLTVIAFNLTIIATFLTRTGVLSSVHAFADTGMGPLFLAFMAVSLVGPFILLYIRRNSLRRDQEPGPLLSRDGSLQLSNIVFVSAVAIVLVGTLFPLISQIFGGEKANLDPSFFNSTVGPIFLATVLLMGICTAVGWRRTAPIALLSRLIPPAIVSLVVGICLALVTKGPVWAIFSFSICSFVICAVLLEVYRIIRIRSRERGENLIKTIGGSIWSSKPRYGAMIVHLGITLIAIGIIGSTAFDSEKEISLSPGTATTISHYTVEYEGLQTRATPSMDIVTATISVQNSGVPVATMKPEKLFHRSFEQPVTEVAIRSTLREDLYIILAGWDQDGTAAFKFMVKPAVKWIWIGGGVMLFGGLLALWRQKRIDLAIGRGTT